jgi:hypothetical protein
MRNSKVFCGCWFCTTFLVYGGTHQLKLKCSCPWLYKTTLGEREISYVYACACFHVTRDTQPQRSVAARHNVFFAISNHINQEIISRKKNMRILLSILSSARSCDVLLWCWATSSLPALLLVMHEEKGEWDLWTIVIVKPTRGMAIRFLGRASAWPLGVLWFMLPRGRL